MSDKIEEEIYESEEQLRQAMLSSDVDSLDELLAANLIFTNHMGQVLTKEDDLEAHRSGILTIDELILSDPEIRVLKEVAVVSVQVHLVGSYNGARSEADFRFTRVWARSDEDIWQVIAGHSSVVAE